MATARLLIYVFVAVALIVLSTVVYNDKSLTTKQRARVFLWVGLAFIIGLI